MHPDPFFCLPSQGLPLLPLLLPHLRQPRLAWGAFTLTTPPCSSWPMHGYAISPHLASCLLLVWPPHGSMFHSQQHPASRLASPVLWSALAAPLLQRSRHPRSGCALLLPWLPLPPALLLFSSLLYATPSYGVQVSVMAVIAFFPLMPPTLSRRAYKLALWGALGTSVSSLYLQAGVSAPTTMPGPLP